MPEIGDPRSITAARTLHVRARAHEQLSSTCVGVHSFSVGISNRELLVQYIEEKKE